jgi:2-hydroxycyclohexanecarboxyl-CoA dehydrogenase
VRGLKGKTVVVTGGAGGIGTETCLRFDLNREAAQGVVDRIAADGGRARAYAVDLTDLAATEAAVASIEGAAEILVNNVGWDLFTPFLKSEPEYWEKIIAINLRAVLNTTRPVLARMAERKSGRIVSIASDAARVGSAGEAVYALQGGGDRLLEDARPRARAAGRHAQRRLPGRHRDRHARELHEGRRRQGEAAHRHPAGGADGTARRPDDLPGAIVFFASDDAAFITGQVISVSGGLTMHG